MAYRINSHYDTQDSRDPSYHRSSSGNSNRQPETKENSCDESAQPQLKRESRSREEGKSLPESRDRTVVKWQKARHGLVENVDGN